MPANDKQIGGLHYARAQVQHWDWAKHLGYLEGCATKYIGRWRDKNGLEDLKKALHYIEKIIEENFPGVRLSWSINHPAEQVKDNPKGVLAEAKRADDTYGVAEKACQGGPISGRQGIARDTPAQKGENYL